MGKDLDRLAQILDQESAPWPPPQEVIALLVGAFQKALIKIKVRTGHFPRAFAGKFSKLLRQRDHLTDAGWFAVAHDALDLLRWLAPDFPYTNDDPLVEKEKENGTPR